MISRGAARISYPLVVLYMVGEVGERELTIGEIIDLFSKTHSTVDEDLLTASIVYLTYSGLLEKTSSEPLRLKVSRKGLIVIGLLKKIFSERPQGSLENN